MKAKTKPTTMKTKIVQGALLTLTLLIAVVLLLTQLNTQAQHNIRGVRTYSGNLSDGATYLIEVPQNWNGTLLLYTQGYSFTPVPAVDTGKPVPFRETLSCASIC